MIHFNHQQPYEVKIGDKIITFKSPIKNVWMQDDVVIVHLQASKELYKEYSQEFWARNIFGFDQNGNQLWQIDGNIDGDGELSVYTGASSQGGQLQAYNWNGVLYNIDPKTGKTTYKAYVK